MSKFLMSSQPIRTPPVLSSNHSVHPEIWPWAHSMIAGSGVAQPPGSAAVLSDGSRYLSRSMPQGPIPVGAAR